MGEPSPWASAAGRTRAATVAASPSSAESRKMPGHLSNVPHPGQPSVLPRLLPRLRDFLHLRGWRFQKGQRKREHGFRIAISFILCRYEKLIIADAGFISPSVWSLDYLGGEPSAFSLSGTALPPACGVPCSLVHPFLAGKKVVAQICPLLAVRRI